MEGGGTSATDAKIPNTNLTFKNSIITPNQDPGTKENDKALTV